VAWLKQPPPSTANIIRGGRLSRGVRLCREEREELQYGIFLNSNQIEESAYGDEDMLFNDERTNKQDRQKLTSLVSTEIWVVSISNPNPELTLPSENFVLKQKN
jgi:hypothetical protein